MIQRRQPDNAARITGLRGSEAPDLEVVERRRLQLWLMTTLLFLSAIAALGLLVFGVNVSLPRWLGPRLVAVSLVGLSVLFSAYAFEKELQLRRLARELVQERILTAALTSRLEEARFLFEAGKLVTAGLDFGEVLETILDTSLDLLDGRHGSIMLVQAENELRTVCSSDRSAARGARVEFGEGIAGRVAATREPLLINGSIRWEHYRDEQDSPPVSAVSVPLVHEHELLGVLNVNAGPGRTYTEHDLRALSTFADQAAVAVANAQLYESQRLSASQSEFRAMHDPLTRLANRTLLMDRVAMSLRRRDGAVREVALLFLDLDDFKRVNDSLGYLAGDSVLCQAAERLRRETREGDTVARFGGDEFAVLLEEAATPDDVLLTARRLMRALEEPMQIRSRELQFTASVGYVAGRSRETTAEELLRDAHTALQTAKQSGKARIVRFEPSMRDEARLRLDLEQSLRRALRRDELAVHFQPIVALPDGRPRAVEALVRWCHPERGLLEPASFLVAAERFGLMVELDQWVLRTACRELVDMERRGVVGADTGVMVNLSSATLHEPAMTPSLVALIEDSGLDPARVTFEITESFMIDNAQRVSARLRALKAQGPRLALDDFGTGYSSLSGLRHLSVDMVKIDQLFVESVHRDASARALVESIVRLGAGLGFQVVGEGIEESAQVECLVEIGCSLGQGFYYAAPAPAEELSSTLHSPSR